MRAHQATGKEASARRVPVWARKHGLGTWLVGVVSGCAGALVMAGVLLAAGGVPTSAPVTTSVQPTVPTTSSKASSGSGITPVLASVDASVVGLTVSGPQGEAQYSGVIVANTGAQCYILTESSPFSASGSSTQVQVNADWGYRAKAHFVSADPSAGIALVKAALYPAKEVTAATPGSVANVQDGEEVTAVGSRYMAGLNSGADFTPGYMSDVMSYIPASGAGDGMFSLLVATGMNVSSWAYGGGLFDSNGNLLGIVTQVPGQSSQPGLTYVTPVDEAMADATAMMKGAQDPHPWLGILGASGLSGQMAQHLGVSGGVEVESVAAGSPAAKAGVADGDLVTSLGGQAVSSVGAMIYWLANAKPGQVVSVRWLASGRWYRKNITLLTQPTSVSPS
jgi:putative serine protease PepD